jgi:PAS domain S-box-containing protein
MVELQQKALALGIERKQRADTEVALRRRDATLSAVVQASPCPIVLAELDNTVRLWNPAAARLFGWAEADVVGAPLPFVPPDARAQQAWLREHVRRGEALDGIETERLRKDGTRVRVLLSVAPLRDEHGVVDAMVLSF